jgi:hypothetical protein
LSNEVRVYQQFCDQNLALKKREDELKHSVDELEAKESELQKTITQLEQHLSVLKSNINATNLNPEVMQKDTISTHDELIPTLNCHMNEKEIPDYHFQSTLLYGKSIFDTKDLL